MRHAKGYDAGRDAGRDQHVQGRDQHVQGRDGGREGDLIDEDHEAVGPGEGREHREGQPQRQPHRPAGDARGYRDVIKPVLGRDASRDVTRVGM